MTEQQVPKLVGQIVEHQRAFLALSRESAQWAVANTVAAIELCVAAIEGRNGSSAKSIPESKIIKLDTTPFNPGEFISKGWDFWKGPADGNGLEGDVVEDSDVELDPSQIQLKAYLESNESSTTGEVRIQRIASAADIPLGPRAFQTFWKNQHLIPKEWKKKTNGYTTYIFFDKVILSHPHGDRYALYLCWHDDRWYWYAYWLGHDRRVSDPSVVLAK